jgi:hypothetical protein
MQMTRFIGGHPADRLYAIGRWLFCKLMDSRLIKFENSLFMDIKSYSRNLFENCIDGCPIVCSLPPCDRLAIEKQCRLLGDILPVGPPIAFKFQTKGSLPCHPP